MAVSMFRVDGALVCVYTEGMTTTQREMPTMIRNREAFKGNSLSAEQLSPGDGSYASTGRLADADLAVFLADSPNIAYLIRSYATPVAWVTSEGTVHLVAQRFSVTTSRYQNMIAGALS